MPPAFTIPSPPRTRHRCGPKALGDEMKRTFAVALLALTLIGCSSLTPRRAPAVFVITRYGAVGDGTTLNTQPFANAIDACRKAGGGYVFVPKGVFLTGPIELGSNVVLLLDKKATIKASDDFDGYGTPQQPSADPLIDEFRPMVRPIIFAQNATNVAIAGGGTIDGSGQKWWDRVNALKAKGATSGKGGVPPGARPRLILMRDCKNVRLDGVTLKNS